MIQIFHGDGTATSRRLLQDAIARDKDVGHEIRLLEGDKLLPRDLDSILSTASLFSIETIVIENLLTRLKSKDKDACIKLIATYSGDKNIFLWDKKEITKANLANLGSKIKISLSKAPTELFTFLEAITPGNAKQALTLFHHVAEATQDIIIFTLLARQIGYLIMVKSATSPKFAPWTLSKLRTQAEAWSAKQLENFLAELLKIDFAVKSGGTKLSYLDHLDILLLTLLG